MRQYAVKMDHALMKKLESEKSDLLMRPAKTEESYLYKKLCESQTKPVWI